MTDETVAQQDFNLNGQQQNPEGMVEDMKEPQGSGVTVASEDPNQQGNNILGCLITFIV